METRETKDMVDSIKMATQRIGVNMAGAKKANEALVALVEEQNKMLARMLQLMEEAEKRRLVQR